jgi:Na+/phosphate symporter
VLGEMVSPTAVLGVLASGVVVLLYGVRLLTTSMQRAAGARMRRALLNTAHQLTLALACLLHGDSTFTSCVSLLLAR